MSKKCCQKEKPMMSMSEFLIRFTISLLGLSIGIGMFVAIVLAVG